MSINWSDASFLQMITVVHLNVGFSLSAMSRKSQNVINGNNWSFHMPFFKVKFNEHLNKATSAKWVVYFVLLQIMLKSPSKGKLVKNPYPKDF